MSIDAIAGASEDEIPATADRIRRQLLGERFSETSTEYERNAGGAIVAVVSSPNGHVVARIYFTEIAAGEWTASSAVHC